MEKEMTFEEALEKLRECVARLDGGNLSLEEMVTTFEEGAEMARVCQERLGTAKGRILKVVESGNGVDEEEFTPMENDK